MRNKTIGLAAGAVLIGATVGVTLTASAAPPTRPPLTVTATTSHEALLVLNSTPGDATGNQFVSAHDIYRGKHKIGTDGASCQVIDVVGPEQLPSPMRRQSVTARRPDHRPGSDCRRRSRNDAVHPRHHRRHRRLRERQRTGHRPPTRRPALPIHHHAPRLNPTQAHPTHPTAHRRAPSPRNVAIPQGPDGCTKEIGEPSSTTRRRPGSTADPAAAGSPPRRCSGPESCHHPQVSQTTLPNTALNAPYEGVDHGVDRLAHFRSAEMLPEGFPYRSAGSTMIDWEL